MSAGSTVEGIHVGWKLFATAFFVLLNGFFVAAEFALVKVRKARIEARAAEGSGAARSVRHILGHLDLYLSACQLGITLASLVLGWLAEPAVATLIIRAAAAMGIAVADSALLHGVALAIALAVITVLHMTVGEQAPKMWALRRSESVSLATAYPLRVFAAVFRPFIWLINVISNWLLKVAGFSEAAIHDEARDAEELRAMLKAATHAGYLSPRILTFGDNVLGLRKLEVRHILVPRVDVVLLSTARSAEENLEILRSATHSRLPLCDPELDDALGFVHVKDVLGRLLAGESYPDLRSLARPLPTVPDTLAISRLIVHLQREQVQCALVVDERGTSVGVVFLEDAIEEIVGPIQDEFDEASCRFERVSEDVVEMWGGLAWPEAKDVLELDVDSDEDTVGGFLVSLLDSIPAAGDAVDVPPYRATVLSVSHRRVERVRFEIVAESRELPSPDPAGPAGS